MIEDGIKRGFFNCFSSLLLFMRTVIVAVTVIGIGVISTVHLTRDTGAGRIGDDILMMVVQPILYGALVVILLIVCITFILGVRRVMTVTNYAVRNCVIKAESP